MIGCRGQTSPLVAFLILFRLQRHYISLQQLFVSFIRHEWHLTIATISDTILFRIFLPVNFSSFGAVRSNSLDCIFVYLTISIIYDSVVIGTKIIKRILLYVQKVSCI